MMSLEEVIAELISNDLAPALEDTESVMGVKLINVSTHDIEFRVGDVSLVLTIKKRLS